MSDETKYRIEAPEEEKEEKEKKGFLRPLPTAPEPVSSKSMPITKFLGITMYEKNRDIIVLLLIPAIVGIIDASVFAQIIVGNLPDSALYIFLIPMLAAISIGLLCGKTSHSLFGGIIAGVFFVVWLLLFLITPALMAPELNIGEFFVSGMVLSAVYFMFVMFASLFGSLVGALMREFF